MSFVLAINLRMPTYARAQRGTGGRDLPENHKKGFLSNTEQDPLIRVEITYEYSISPLLSVSNIFTNLSSDFFFNGILTAYRKWVK